MTVDPILTCSFGQIEQPATVFSVLENAGKTVVFTSDTLFDLLLLKLTNVYSKKFKIESKGARFEIGDFLVKLGVVSAAGSVKVHSILRQD